MGDWFSDLMQGLKDAEVAANSPTLPGASGVATKLGEVADNAGNTSYVRQPKITLEYGIYPAIGIARVGNQPVSITDDTTYYLGPEIPGWNKWPPASFELKKDTGGVKRIRPQGCRFRVFRRKFKDGVFESEEVLDLAHAEVAKVTWKVNVENTKAAGPIILGSGGDRNPSRRADLAKLKLTPGTKTLVCDALNTRRSVALSLPGSGVMPSGFNTGASTATDTITSLGTAGNDDKGNLIVIGGLGKAVTDGATSSLAASFNNDDWFDDIFDGWVSAEVELKDGTKITSDKIKQAWVLSAPPDFAPAVLNIVSGWDVLRDIGVRELGAEKALYDGGTFKTTYRPRFDDDIKPILQATWQVFASSGMAQVHSTDFSAFTHDKDAPTKSRTDLFKKLTKPDGFTMAIGSASGNMPALDSDPSGPKTTLTHTQYFLMYQWSQKIVDAGSVLPTTITSQGLTRAALEQSIGSALYPGIEFTKTIRNKNWFSTSPRYECRIDTSKVAPGDVSQQMALPWQGDFSACDADWWPSLRPDTIKRGGTYQTWDDGVSTGTEMVTKWWKLGWVKKTGATIADYVEADRQVP